MHVRSIILLALLFGIGTASNELFDTNNCNCSSNYKLVINESFPGLLLQPTRNEFYYAYMKCEWKIQIDTKNEAFMAEIYADLFLNSNDRLIICECDTLNIIYDSSVSKHKSFYTQAEEICVKFASSNNTQAKRNFFWNIRFLLFSSPKQQTYFVSKYHPINFVARIANFTLLTISASNGTLECYYRGINRGIPLSGIFYAYQSRNLKNFSGILLYPQNNISKIHVEGNQLTLFYIGSSSNNIIITYRIKEYHEANCIGTENLIFLNSFLLRNEIGALTSGPCILSFINPLSDVIMHSYHMSFFYMKYENDSPIAVVYGYNSTFTLFEFNKTTVQQYNGINNMGTLTSWIIPPGSMLIGNYFTTLYSTIGRWGLEGDMFLDVNMTPNYPNWVEADNFTMFYQYDVAYASITLKIVAEVPEQCLFLITDGQQQTFADSSQELFINKTIRFNATYFEINFIGVNDNHTQWRGFLVHVEGHRINPPNDITIVHPKKKTGLIVGLTSASLIIIIALIILITWYLLKKRRERFDQLCQVLKEMDISLEDIEKMKQKSNELIIPEGKLHINFDGILGRDSHFTVYKGHLIGISPIHVLQKSIHTQRFVDCDVAVKIADKFGQDEVEQLFKEIEVMKMIGYHENIMCMLGWTTIEKNPCLVFDIAEKDLLNFVQEFQESAEEQFPYQKFLSILWQVVRGMEYIASKGLVHCDLAARNILLCGSFVAKISNFGHCYSFDFNQLLSISSVKNLQIRWLAPEVLTDQIFSEKSDVWSFGIDGELLEFLQSGHRLECPNNLSNPMDQIIITCWHLDPEQRPTFKELEERFYKLIELFSQVYEYV